MLSQLKALKLVKRTVKPFFLGSVACILCLLLSEPLLQTGGQPAASMDQSAFLKDSEVQITAQAIAPTEAKLPDQRVLVTEVVVQGTSEKLQAIVYQAAATKPGRTTTRSQLQTDINAIFKTGWFSNVKAVPEDTSKGVRVTFVVQTNPVLRRVTIVPIPNSKSVLPASVVNDSFRSQYGTMLNLQTLQAGINKINQWYQTNGYILAQVLEAPRVSPDGVVTLQIAEGVIESLQVQFVNSENKPVNADGQPVIPNTPAAVILQAVKTKPGMVLNRAQIENDLKQVLNLSVVKDAKIVWEPAQTSRKVLLVLNVQAADSITSAAKIGLQQARAQKDPIAKAAALRSLAKLGADVSLYQMALKLSQASRDRAGEAEALEGLAYVYNSQAKLKTNDSYNNNNQPSFDAAKKKQAISAYQAALKLYQDLNNDTQAAIILRNIGFLLEELEDYPAAIATYRQAVPLFQTLKQPFWQALTLNDLAASYRGAGEIDQSLMTQQQALLIWQFLRDHPNQLESTSLLSRLNRPGDRLSWTTIYWVGSSKSGTQGDFKLYLGVKDLRKGGLVDVHLAEATTLLNIGGIYQAVGDYQQALYAFKTFLVLLQSPPNVIQSLIQTGSGSQEDKRLLSELMPGLIDASGALLMSTLYADIGWQQQAQSYRDHALTKGGTVLEKALHEIAISNPKQPELNSLLPTISPLIAGLVSNLGSDSSPVETNQMLINWFNQSMPLLQQALARQPEYKAQWQPILSWLDVFYNYTQGEELARANKFQQAAVVYRQALTQWKNLLPRDLQAATVKLDFHSTDTNFTTTSTLSSLGLMPLVLEIYNQAGYVFQAKTYTALGKALLAMGKPQEAIGVHQQAVQLLQAGHDALSKQPQRDRASKTPALDQSVDALVQFARSMGTLFWAKRPDAVTADAFFQLGKAYAANRQNALALEAYSRALPLWRKASDGLHEADTYWEMAIVQRQQGDLAQAKTQIETAIERIELGGELQTSYQLQKAGTEKPVLPQKPSSYRSYLNLADYLASKHNYYEFYIDLLMQLHQQSPTAGYAELAFQASERSHARSLRSMLNRATRPNTANSSAIPAKLQAIQLAQPLPLKDLQQQLLDDNTILLEYALGEEHSYLWAVTPKGLQTYTLPKQAAIEAVSRDYIELLQSPSYRVGDQRGAASQASANAVQVDAAKQLSQMLLEPVATQLSNKRLLIVSDGILHYLPFAALPEPATMGKNQAPLFVDHEIVGLPSASLRIGLQHQANAKAPTKTLAVLADPIFSRDDQRFPHRASDRATDVESLYSRLPGTRREASQIVGLVPPAKTLDEIGWCC